jgi:hypothetical protein
MIVAELGSFMAGRSVQVQARQPITVVWPADVHIDLVDLHRLDADQPVTFELSFTGHPDPYYQRSTWSFSL